MSYVPIASRRFSATSGSCLTAILVFFSVARLLAAPPQSTQSRQNLHSVLSHVKLTPPLRSPEVSLRYSPDGNYLLLQDPAGVAVFLRNPLQILFHISTENAYPAQFSVDSKSVVLVFRDLSFTKWRLSDGGRIAQGDLPGKEECVDGQLSPGSEFFACLQPDLHFVLMEISSKRIALDEFVPPALPSTSGNLRSFHPPIVHFFISLDNESAFPSPFGILRTGAPRANPNRSLSSSSIYFSPDAKMLLAGYAKNLFGIDVPARKRFDPPGQVQKAFQGAIVLQSAERFIASGSPKGGPSEAAATVLSLRNGEVLAKIPVSATRLSMASNPRFLISHKTAPDGPSAAAFDLEQNLSLETPPALALDIYGNELAVYTVNGSIAFYRLGERDLLAHLPLPLSTLPLPRAAAVTPNLDKLALAIDGAGALFDISSGQRLSTLTQFSAANFLDEQEASLLFPRLRDEPPHISRVSISNGVVSPSWEIGKEQQLRSGGPVLLEYSFLKGAESFLGEIPPSGAQAPYELHALDQATGKELWKRQFKDNPPTPFADPQGQRLVLGWRAKSSEAKSVMAHNPAVSDLLKGTKLTDHDSYFEVLDAQSGASIGGLLVTVGNGPTTFDAAFSVGDAVVLEKDGVRVSIYSMRDGQSKARLVGVWPSATAESNLLALNLGGGRLGIFDLTSGAKLDEQVFPDGLAYTHFSADGERLFVLTEHQTAVILDVTQVRNASNAAAKSEEH